MTIAASAQVSERAKVDPTARVWDLAQVREFAKIGKSVVVGRNSYIGVGVSVGENSKIQNNAQIFEPAILEEGVFIGPGVILTNDTYPRAITSEGIQKDSSDWKAVGVHVREGASIGAGAICVAPVVIGSWSMVAAGSVVTRDVPDFALVAGVPAKQIGWVGKNGERLEIQDDSDILTSEDNKERYKLFHGILSEI